MAGISWIKLSVNIFDDEKIKLIRKMPEGDAMLIIWIELLCLAGKTNDSGAVYIGQGLNYTDEMLATICDEPLNTIRLALQTFLKFKMIDLKDDGLIIIESWEKHQNIEGMNKIREQNRVRKQRQRAREKNKAIESGHVTSRDSHATDKIIDKNKNKNKNRLELDDNNNINIYTNISNLEENKKKTIDYYYRQVKNNTSKDDLNLVVAAIDKYGFKRIIYTLWYLKNEQKANVTSFRYVEKVLESQKALDQASVDFVAGREIGDLKKAEGI